MGRLGLGAQALREEAWTPHSGLREGPATWGPPVTSFSQNEADLGQSTAGHFLCASPGPGLTPSSPLGPTAAWKP